MNNQQPPKIALLHWGDLIEDFLDEIGVSFEAFCAEMTGGWMFGYIEALRSAGVETILICVSARVSKITYRTHLPTGAKICVLPASNVYRAIRRLIPNPYGDAQSGDRRFVSRVRRFLYPFLKDIVSYFATPLWKLGRELHRQNFRAVLCQEYEYPRFDVCVLLGTILRKPVFAVYQGGNFQFSRLERFLRPLTVKFSEGLIIGSREETERVKSLYRPPSEKIGRIFNPMDVSGWTALEKAAARAALGIPVDAEVAASHGRIDIYVKGLDVLLNAWEKLCRERPQRDLRLLLVGTGAGAGEFQRLIDQKELRNVIWINEYVRDRAAIRSYLSAADVYVLASRREGFPVAPLEAMSCNLPVVAADAPGMADILESGEESGGMIVPREDENALALALGRVLDDPELAEKMGASARLRAEQAFSTEAIGGQLRDFLLQTSGFTRRY